ncbi:hypothetical protein MMC16_001193 [Acarospora aff. strigata]|nr:hypothetical protein [Acarospora aff. strigata]
MEYQLLPATTYQPPPRQVRRRALNTIIEDEQQSETDERHLLDDMKGPQMVKESSLSPHNRYGHPSMPPASAWNEVPSPVSMSSSSSPVLGYRKGPEFDDLYDATDEENEEATLANPTVVIRPPSVYSDSSGRESTSSAGSRKRFPSLIIPSPGLWPTVQSLQSAKRNSPIPPTPPPKIPMSPAVFSFLTRDLPASTAPPSLDGSLTSEQLACSSAPITPIMQVNGGGVAEWGQEVQVRPDSLASQQTVIDSEPVTPDIEFRIENPHQWDLGVQQHIVIGKDDDPIPATVTANPSLPTDSPLLGQDEGVGDGSIELHPNAMVTLQHLSLSDVLGSPTNDSDIGRSHEMQEVVDVPTRPKSAELVTPASVRSQYSMTALSIPSPGGFFSSLGAGARRTWCVQSSGPPSIAPPSSTTAEQFYNCPWNSLPGDPVERVIELYHTDTDGDGDGPPTARQVPALTPKPTVPAEPEAETEVQEIKNTELLYEYDDKYDDELQQLASANLDRTTVWLAAQGSYLAALRETNPMNEVGVNEALNSGSKHGREQSLDSPMKKAVRFLEANAQTPHDTPSAEARKESVYYHAFQHMANKTHRKDTFIHSQTRFDALQAGRVCLRAFHVDQLMGSFGLNCAERPAPPRPISLMPGSSDEVDTTSEQRVFARVERERQALEQVKPPMWIIEALKFLNGGELLNSPGSKILTGALPPLPGSDGISSRRARILDLGGQASCDWAWHCARKYPDVKTYTVVTKQQVIDTSIRGPHNHRQVSVPHLWKLPFRDGHFDVISARSLYTFLKTEKLGEAGLDEYDSCLKECIRCLKPGGYLEFSVLDSEIVHPGSLGSAMSVEFGFNLKTRGYDPAPTKSWLSRLRRAGFMDIKRAWLYLPMGAPGAKLEPLRETPSPLLPDHSSTPVEAVRGPLGSTADAANISGMVSTWAWEQWILKLQTEMGKDKQHLLDGVGAVFEEGRNLGAGWRCLSGWARKPL